VSKSQEQGENGKGLQKHWGGSLVSGCLMEEQTVSEGEKVTGALIVRARAGSDCVNSCF